MSYFQSEGDVELREVSGEMNSVLGSGKLVVAPAGNEHATLLQAAVSGTKDSAAGPQAASISVGSVLTFPLVTTTTQAAFKVIDTRTVSFATEDYLTQYYITFSKSTDTAVVDELKRVLSALAEGKQPTPAPGPGLTPYPSVPSAPPPPAAAAAVAAAAPAESAGAQPEAAKEAAAADAARSDAAPSAAAAQPGGPPNVKQVTDLMGAMWNLGAGMVQKAGDELRKKAAEDTKTLQEMGAKIQQRAQQDTKILQDALAGKPAEAKDKPAPSS